MSSFRRVPTRKSGHDARVGWDRNMGGYCWAVWDIPDCMQSDDPAIAHGDGKLLTVDDLIGDSWNWIDWRDQKDLIITLMGDAYREDREARPEAQALVDEALGRPAGQFQSPQQAS